MGAKLAIPPDVVLASGNAGKLAELRDALASSGLRLQAQSAFAVPEAVEDGLTFIENALIKARHAALLTGRAALADDSGLVVPALGGAPGIHSARYSGRGDAANNVKLLAAMAELTGNARLAWFQCVLVLLREHDDPSPVIAEGRWMGRIALETKGDGGFGYDPIFLVGDSDRTAAELDRDEKIQMSHRGQAVALLRQQLGA